MTRSPEHLWEPKKINYAEEEKWLKFSLDEYECPVPPVPTTMWNKYDWCKWIDNHGTWTPYDHAAYLDEPGEPEDCRFDTTRERDDFYEEIERDA